MQEDHRRLVAILSADVAGFSRLMAEDESGTLASLKAHLGQLIGPAIAASEGRIVKTTGDGVLAAFGSAVKALACAAHLQEAMRDRNAGIDLGRRIEFRMGLNLGDVIEDDGDIFGDSVNIAARLQALARPGGLCVSGKMLGEVGNRHNYSFVDHGPQALKNIAEPVHMFSLGGTGPETAKVAHAALRRPAVAVLPFTNMSGDPDQDYFADGLTEDIITALTHWRSFPVIARNSTFVYKGRSVEIPQVARELNARYVLEGSVRRGGDRVRITAQLVDGETAHHIWAEHYDRALGDIFALQDEITDLIAATVAPELARIEFRRSAAKGPTELDLYDYLLRGRAALSEATPEGNERAKQRFAQARQLRPDTAEALAGLADCHNRDILLRCSPDVQASAETACALARQAVAADPSSPVAHYALSTAYVWLGRPEAALAEARVAHDLNPHDPAVLHAYGNKSDLAGDPEGLGRMEIAQRLDPQSTSRHIHLTFLARAHANIGAFEAALGCARRAIDRRADYAPAHYALALALAGLDRRDEAHRALAECDALQPGFTASRQHWEPYVDPASNLRLMALLDGL